MKIGSFTILLWIYLVGFIPFLNANPQLSTITPAPNSLLDERAQTFSFHFSDELSTTLSTYSLLAEGTRSGILDGMLSVSDSTLTWRPYRNFQPGERITLTLKRVGASPLTYQYQWFIGSHFSTRPTFQKKEIFRNSGGSYALEAVDTDRDGDVDFFSGALFSDQVYWWENNGSSYFWPRSVSDKNDGPRVLTSGDFDRDGNVDLVSASSNDTTLALHQNFGNGNFERHVISTEALSVRSLLATDLDRDGQTDFLAGFYSADALVWFKNNGDLTFSQQTLADELDGIVSIFATDIDNDGDSDILTASANSNSIVLFVQESGFTFSRQTISTLALGVESVSAADFNGDGKMDILAASNFDDTIAWFKQEENGSFTRTVISTQADAAHAAVAVDLDGDRDVDVISAASGGNTLAWYENNGAGIFTARAIGAAADGGQQLAAFDADQDRDIDIFITSELDDTLFWFENTASKIDNRIPSTPENLVFQPLENAVRVAWKPVQDDDFRTYRIYFGTDAQALPLFETTDDWQRNDTTRTFSGLENGTTYFVRVAAVDSAAFESIHTPVLAATPAEKAFVLRTTYPPGQNPVSFWYQYISLAFSKPIDRTTINDEHLRVYGSVSGKLEGSFWSEDSVLTWYPARPYLGNETIEITVLNGFGSTTSKLQTPLHLSWKVVPQKTKSPTFAALPLPSISGSNVHYAPFDYDRDGIADLIYTSPDANELGWIKSSGNSFTPFVISNALNNPTLSVLFDIENNRQPEIAVFEEGSKTLSLFKNLDGNPQNPTEVAVFSESLSQLETMDWNNDFAPDFMVLGSGNGQILFLENLGESFAEAVPFSGTSKITHFEKTDFDADGDLDLVAFENGQKSLYLIRNANGNPVLETLITISENLSSVQLAFLSNDPFPDLVIGTESGVSAALRTSLVSPIVFNPLFAGGNVAHVKAGDLNGDTFTDIVVAQEDGTITFLEQNEDAGFSNHRIGTTASTPNALFILDLDADYDGDVLVSGDTFLAGFKNTVSQIDVIPPGNPWNLQGLSNHKTIALRWNHGNEPDLDHFKIYTQIWNRNETFVDLVDATEESETSFTKTNLVNGLWYNFRVTAVDTAGLESGVSNDIWISPQGLMAWFPFESGFSDAVGTAIARPQGDVQRAPYAAESVYRNTTSGSYLAGDSSLSLHGRSFSVSFWAKRRTVNKNDFVFGLNREETENHALHIGFRENNQFTFDFWANGLNTPETYTDSLWHHWTAVFDESIPGEELNRFIYRDGIQVAADRSDDHFEGEGGFTIGIMPTLYNGTEFSGDIDDVKIWNFALSPDSVLAELVRTNMSPEPVSQVQAEALPRSVKLSWNASIEADFDFYRVLWKKESASTFSEIKTKSRTRADSTLLFSELDFRSRYLFQLSVVDTLGNESAIEPTFITPLEPDIEIPVAHSLQALQNDGSVRLKWTSENRAFVSFYEIYSGSLNENGAKMGETERGNPADTTFLITGLTNYTPVVYRIAVVDTFERRGNFSLPIETNSIDLTPPEAPVLSSAEAQNGSILVRWPKIVLGDLKEYRVFVTPENGNESTFTTTDSLFQIPNLTNDIRHAIQLAAADTNGNVSPKSPIIWRTPFENSTFVPLNPQLSGTSLEPTINAATNEITFFPGWAELSGTLSLELNVAPGRSVWVLDVLVTPDETGKYAIPLAIGERKTMEIRDSGGNTRFWTIEIRSPNLASVKPVLKDLTGGNLRLPRKTILWWNAVPLVDDYQIQLGTSSDFATIVSDKSRVSTIDTTILLNYGTTYFWRIRGRSGGQLSQWSDSKSFQTIVYASSEPLSAQKTFADFRLETSYRMMSLPGNDNVPFESVFGTGGGSNWIVWDYQNAQNVDVSNVANSVFKPGKAFWTLSKSAVTIQRASSALPLNESEEASIALVQGWNMVGNPFTSAIPVTNLAARNTSLGNFYRFIGTGYEEADSLKPFEGYFYFRSTAGNLNIPLVIQSGTTSAKSAAQPDSVLLVELFDSAGNNDRVLVATSASAEIGFDAFDQPSPPFGFSALHISSRSTTIPLRRDVRPAGETGFVIPLQLHSKTALPVQLSISKRAYTAYVWRIINQRTGKITDEKNGSTITLSSAETNDAHILLFGTASFLTEKQREFQPSAFALHQNYPNPFNPETTFSFSLPKSGSTKLEIFDVNGRMVGQVVHGELASGFHTFRFNARSLSSGVYLYRLTSGTFVQHRKMILVK